MIYPEREENNDIVEFKSRLPCTCSTGIKEVCCQPFLLFLPSNLGIIIMTRFVQGTKILLNIFFLIFKKVDVVSLAFNGLTLQVQEEKAINEILNINMVLSWKKDWDKCLLIGGRPTQTTREQVISWPVKYKSTFSFCLSKSLLLIIDVGCSRKQLISCREIGVVKAHTE